MTRSPESTQGLTRYPLRFGAVAVLLVAATLALVLYVIPQRYVLSPGFRESGLSFPSPTTPFGPLAAVSVPAQPLPAPPAEILPGPAELLWEAVTPLLRAREYGAAVPLFEDYLRRHPGDTDARRELAVTLLAAGRPAEAVPVLRTLLEDAPDPGLRLVLARALRDLGWVSEASREYARLVAARPNDEALVLEWARAHAWVEQYDSAAEILLAAREQLPRSSALGVELARVYYAQGRLRDAVVVIAEMDEDGLAAAGAMALRDDLMASVVVMADVVPAPEPPTRFEEAASARAAGDFERAERLLDEAVSARPNDRALWLAYANLLEYELGDLEGARAALLQAERLGPQDPSLQLRLARLDVWTGRDVEAAQRLEALSVTLDEGAVGSAAVSRADVLALLGDLRRWEGDRMRAAHSYEEALAADPESQRGRDGLDALDSEVEQQLVEVEAPRVGAAAYSLGDTDDFGRVDAAGEWIDLTDTEWVWGGTVGQRWLSGYDLAGIDASRHGVFFDLELARWWRWGTLRSGLDFGAQRVRSAWDLSLGASLRHRGTGSADTELRLEHGPAYPLANTLQSVLAEVVQDRLSVTYARPFGERWSIAAALDAARLRAADASVVRSSSATTRLQIALSAGRTITGSLSLGLSTSALAFTEAAPLTPLSGAGARPLYWDPRFALSAGPYANLDHPLSGSWSLTGRLSPGLALIDERRPATAGLEVVPQASVEAGARHEGRLLRTSLEIFYYQGQFDGYRSYGARVAVGARDLRTLGGTR